MRAHCDPRVVSFGISARASRWPSSARARAPALVARAASARVAPRRASPPAPLGPRLARRVARRVAPHAAKTELETPSTTAGDPASNASSGDAFDDPVATQFKAMYATPGSASSGASS